MHAESIRKVLLYVGEGGDRVKQKVINALGVNGIEVEKDPSGSYDVVVVVGTDGDLLEFLQEFPSSAPIFHVSPPGYTTFYASVEWEELGSGLSKISRGEYHLDPSTRLNVNLGSGEKVHALNEVAIFPSRSATVMEYSLLIDDEVLWKDKADGAIVSTPAGSTAYAFSAGGPMILKGSRVFVVVPVNSLNPMRRSLVVPEDSDVVIQEISSSSPVEAVIDGVRRVKIRERIEIKKGEPVIMVKLTSKVGENIERKIKLALDRQDIPPSAKFVLKMLQIYGEASPKDLLERTGLPERTVRHALSILVRRGYVKKITNPRNIQQKLYRISRS
ncbi:N-acetylmuramoyl-L-alanine amidase [Metallosphaera hakonensis JCM 8857 = DSM 7519]|uniref:NAD kinase n=2 Tax=Metallosphaera hakonensis TaxID=79601 RepID=A0A2U9IXL3_9CREN|nr:N-acetylmuramoyl-L-alanine amidase [Metallosphaera hakonensis JCM 8857 = DSM 7519]